MAVGLSCAVPACGSSNSGTEIVVSMPKGTQQVFVYASTEAGSDLSIAPAGVQTPVQGMGWPIDGIEAVHSANASSKTFVFQSSSGATSITKLVAFGLGSDGKTLTGFDEESDLSGSTNAILRYPITLGDPTGYSVSIWGADKCLHVAHAGSDDEYMVSDPQQDPDCDTFQSGSANECVPDVYDGQRGPVLGEATCTLSGRRGSSQTVSVCTLGGPYCTDGQTSAGSGCDAQTAYCMPQSACQLALGALENVPAAQLTNSSTTPVGALRCQVDAQESQDIAGSLELCPGFGAGSGSDAGSDTVTIDDPIPFAASNASCSNARVRTDQATSVRSDGSWRSQVELLTNQLSLEVQFNNGCTLELQLKAEQNGVIPAMGGEEQRYGALGAMTVAPANGGAPRGIAVPIIFIINDVTKAGGSCLDAQTPKCSFFDDSPGSMATNADLSSLLTCLTAEPPAETAPPE